jgi:hypothetical protein
MKIAVFWVVALCSDGATTQKTAIFTITACCISRYIIATALQWAERTKANLLNTDRRWVSLKTNSSHDLFLLSFLSYTPCLTKYSLSQNHGQLLV